MQNISREEEYQALRSFLKLASAENSAAELVRCAIQEALTPRQRQLVRMYYLQQMPMQTIARELGVAPSTVCRTLERARKRLEQCLKYGGRNFMYLIEN